MRIYSSRVLAALVPALICVSGSAQAQVSQFLKPVSLTSQSFTSSSYYADESGGQSVTAGAATQSAGSCGSCQNTCECIGNWRDNTQVWFGADAYKSIGDAAQPLRSATGFMNSAGVVSGFNTGFRLGQSRVRGQIGASYGIYDLKGRDTASPSSSEQQTFVTFGFSKRSDILHDDRISWGLVYDQFFGHQWGLFGNEVYLSQVRGIMGYALNECNEIGVWGTFHANNDASVVNVGPVRASNQANAYWRHNWDFGGSTMAYVGGVDRADIGNWLVGVLGQAPLSDNVSLYANTTFAFPSSKTGIVGSNELEWNFGLGLMYSFGGKAVSPSVSGQQGLPLLPVANNGSMLITN